MSEFCMREQLSIQELLNEVKGVEVLETPFPKSEKLEMVVVRPTRQFYAHGFLMCSKGRTGSASVHFQLDGERSNRCYSSACVCCVPSLHFRRPSDLGYEESARLEYLGLPKIHHEEEDIRNADKEWHGVMKKRFEEILVGFCKDNDLETLFVRRASTLNLDGAALRLVEVEDSLNFLLNSYSPQEISKGFHFIHSAGMSCSVAWPEGLTKAGI